MSEVVDITGWLAQPRVFVRVYRLPGKLTDGYRFGGGRPVSFLNVDWFEHPHGRIDAAADLIEFIKQKQYYDPLARFLVLGDHPDFTFTIEPAGGQS